MKVNKELIEPSMNNLKNLVETVNAILDLYQMKKNKKAITWQEFPLRETLIDILKLFKLEANKKNIYVKLKIGKEIPGNIS